MTTIRDLHDDGYRVTFTARLDDGSDVDFTIDVPDSHPVVTDSMGRHLTRSGAWQLPAVEVDGEWQARPEDPADPWQRTHQPRDVPTAVDAAVTAYLTRRRHAGT